MDDVLHVGNVQTPSSNVRGNQKTTGIRGKARGKREEGEEEREELDGNLSLVKFCALFLHLSI